MSFILDALKKSELERQRQTIPGLVDSVTVRPRARLPAWAIALCSLLAVNLIVLVIVLARAWITATPEQPAPAAQARRDDSKAGRPAPGGAGAGQLAAAAAAGAPAGTGPAAPGSDHFSPLDAAPVYAPEIPVAPARPAQAAPSPPSNGVGGTAARAVHGRDPLLTENDYSAKDEEVLPTISEMSLTGDQALPELHLDVHVFATHAAERFVYINMRKYHEGATLQEGPTIERIRRDGVVLNYQGLRFLLPRQ
ncbi:MAG: general secretion pathway protein GspB [Steroidobacteraceae bacterium]|jgi:general secretion pathway protein B